VAFTGLLEQHQFRIRKDGDGRYADNVFICWLWHTLKHEEIENLEPVTEIWPFGKFTPMYGNLKFIELSSSFGQTSLLTGKRT